jgi:DNA invertase Pin-like site-specific DNA recombinase
MTTTGRYVGYVRVSTDKQGRSGLGLDAQRSAILGFLNGGPWDLLQTFVETESGRRKDRPELIQALALCRVTGATLIIAKLDRLARNATFLMALIDSGVDVLFCDMPQIPAGPTGRFILQQMANVAELEAGLISERTKAALQAAKARGTVLGGFRGKLPSAADRQTAAQAKVAKADAVARDLSAVIVNLKAEGIRSANALAKALKGHGNDSDIKGTHQRELMQDPSLTAAGVH